MELGANNSSKIHLICTFFVKNFPPFNIEIRHQISYVLEGVSNLSYYSDFMKQLLEIVGKFEIVEINLSNSFSCFSFRCFIVIFSSHRNFYIFPNIFIFVNNWFSRLKSGRNIELWER